MVRVFLVVILKRIAVAILGVLGFRCSSYVDSTDWSNTDMLQFFGVNMFFPQILGIKEDPDNVIITGFIRKNDLDKAYQCFSQMKKKASFNNNGAQIKLWEFLYGEE